MELRRVALTTSDNPFDPFDDFDRWYRFDESKGYMSSGMVARVADISDELSEGDRNRAIEEAINFIVEVNPTSNYKKLVRTS